MFLIIIRSKYHVGDEMDTREDLNLIMENEERGRRHSIFSFIPLILMTGTTSSRKRTLINMNWSNPSYLCLFPRDGTRVLIPFFRVFDEDDNSHLTSSWNFGSFFSCYFHHISLIIVTHQVKTQFKCDSSSSLILIIFKPIHTSDWWTWTMIVVKRIEKWMLKLQT